MYKNSTTRFGWLDQDFFDNLLFVIIAATAFTSVLCHWILDILYKYRKGIEGNKYIIDFRAVFVIICIASLYYVLKKGYIKFDFALIMLLQAMLMAGVIDYQNENFPEVCYTWIIPSSYIIGKLVIGRDIKTATYRTLIMYVVLAIPAYIDSTLDIGVNWVTGWQWGTERWPLFWTGDIEARTTFEYGYILTTVAVGFAILNFKRHKIISLIIFGLIGFEQYLIYCVQGRQNPVLLVITLLMSAAMFLYDSRHNISKAGKKKIFRGFICFLGFILFVSILFKFDFWGIKTLYENSYWAPGGFLKNERFFRNWLAFKHMLKYPTVNYSVRYGYYHAHSLLLEYGRLFGLTTWGMLTIFRILILIQVFRMAIRASRYSWIKYLMVPAVVSVNIYYTMEPNNAAFRHMWMYGLFLSGMVRGWLELEEDSNYIPKMICPEEVKNGLTIKDENDVEG